MRRGDEKSYMRKPVNGLAGLALISIGGRPSLLSSCRTTHPISSFIISSPPKSIDLGSAGARRVISDPLDQPGSECNSSSRTTSYSPIRQRRNRTASASLTSGLEGVQLNLDQAINSSPQQKNSVLSFQSPKRQSTSTSNSNKLTLQASPTIKEKVLPILSQPDCINSRQSPSTSTPISSLTNNEEQEQEQNQQGSSSTLLSPFPTPTHISDLKPSFKSDNWDMSFTTSTQQSHTGRQAWGGTAGWGGTNTTTSSQNSTSDNNQNSNLNSNDSEGNEENMMSGGNENEYGNANEASGQQGMGHNATGSGPLDSITLGQLRNLVSFQKQKVSS